MKSAVFLVLCLLIGATIPNSNANGIPSQVPDGYTYLEAFKSSYKVYKAGDDYEDAVLRCQWDGATMFHPRSQAEADAVFSLTDMQIAIDDPIFIGVHDWMGTGNFTSLDGEPIFNNTLTTPEPPKLQHFAVMYRSGKVLKLQGISHRLRTVCRVMHTRACRTIDLETDGYTLLEGFKASYKYYSSQPLYRANLRCLTDGAELFSPDSHSESLEIFRTVALGKGSINLGINDYFRSGSLRTINGERSFYSNWLPGHPWSTRYAYMRNDTIFLSNTDVGGFICKRRIIDCAVMTTPVYVSKTKQIYQFFDDKKTFFEAEGGCKAQMGTLMLPNSVDELNSISESLKNANDIASDNWLGFYLPGSNGFALSVEGKVLRSEYLTATNVSQGCGIFNLTNSVNVVGCDQLNTFVCQYEDNQEFNDYPVVGKAFKFSPVALRWHDAVEYCHDQDSILAMPDHSAEKNVLTMLLREQGLDVMFVAFHSLLTNSPTVQVQGFKNISSDLSWNDNLSSESNFCGGMDENGLVARIDCNTPRHFFCAR